MNIPFKTIGQAVSSFSMLGMFLLTFLSGHPGLVPGATGNTCTLGWTVNVDNMTATVIGHGTKPGVYNLWTCGSATDVQNSPVRYCKRVDDQAPSSMVSFLGGMTVWSCKVG